jgi:cell division septum initiation protein DivIVA
MGRTERPARDGAEPAPPREPEIPMPDSTADVSSPFDELMATASAAPAGGSFTTAFRGYDKDEVDQTIAGLRARLRAEVEQISADANTRVQELEADLAAARQATAESGDDLDKKIAAATRKDRSRIKVLETELAAAEVKASTAEQRFQALSEELVEAKDDAPGDKRFEEILRVAEEQASLLIRNATVQGERLLASANTEIQNRRRDAEAEAQAIISAAQSDAQQARLKIDTELTAHSARIERETAHAAEKISQAEQEAAAIRSEAEKGAAALRSMVARETDQSRAEAEEAVREMRVRVLEFEASLSRRQDDAQQEFLVLHNQAVAHAERITQDANEQVAASLDHAQRVAGKADDFEKLMRAQAQQIEADATLRANAHLDHAREKAQRIIEMVTTHSQAVLRDAEDRTRQLRWQQHQLTSFMAEVKELIRPESPLADVESPAEEPLAEGEASDETAQDVDGAEVEAAAVVDEQVDEPGAESADESDRGSESEPAA